MQSCQHRALLEPHQFANLARAVAHQDLQHQRFAIIVVELVNRLAHIVELVVRRLCQQRLLRGRQVIDIDGLETATLEIARIFASYYRQQPMLGSPVFA